MIFEIHMMNDYGGQIKEMRGMGFECARKVILAYPRDYNHVRGHAGMDGNLSVIASHNGEIMGESEYKKLPFTRQGRRINVVMTGNYYQHCVGEAFLYMAEWFRKTGISATYHFLGDRILNSISMKENAGKDFNLFDSGNIKTKSGEVAYCDDGKTRVRAYLNGDKIYDSSSAADLEADIYYWTDTEEFRRGIVSNWSAVAATVQAVLNKASPQLEASI